MLFAYSGVSKWFICMSDYFLFLSQIELIDRVDDIYRNTTWSKEFKNYGVQIHQVCMWLCVITLQYCQMLTF